MHDQDSLGSIVARATEEAKARRFERAAALLEEVIAIDPDHLKALDLFGFVRFFQGRFAEAEGYCRRALAIDPDRAYAHKGLGLCVARQGRLEEGVASLERAIALRPAWSDPYWDLGVVLADAGRFEQALDVLGQGAAMVPAKEKDFRRFQAQVRHRKAEAGKRTVDSVGNERGER
jgi:tetratricopeptide (TPR) repeat protein